LVRRRLRTRDRPNQENCRDGASEHHVM
jgi:hypothetical protein